jgi:hypothetical protein
MTRPGRAVFTLLLLGGAFWLLAETLTLGAAARLAPLWVIAPTCALLTILLVLEVWPGSRGVTSSDSARTDGAAENGRPNGELAALLWFGALAVMVLMVGVLAAVPVFFFLYVALRWHRPWWLALAIGAATFAVLYLIFTVALGLYLPVGWLVPE